MSKAEDNKAQEQEPMVVPLDGIELDDEMLDAVAGGFLYHDEGDTHRKEAYYVVDDDMNIVMKVDDIGVAKHWADNLRTSAKMLSADEFSKLRKQRGSL